MDKVMHELGNTLSDQDVNAVASQHFDAQQVVKKKSECKSSHIKRTVKLYEQILTVCGLPHNWNSRGNAAY